MMMGLSPMELLGPQWTRMHAFDDRKGYSVLAFVITWASDPGMPDLVRS